jgi:hypothetical protein
VSADVEILESNLSYVELQITEDTHVAGVSVRQPSWHIGSVYQPRMMSVEPVESQLAGETEVLGENLRQWHLVHHKSHVT